MPEALNGNIKSKAMDVAKTDVQKIIVYLNDAAKLYDALAALPMLKAASRAHMIKQLTDKLKSKLQQK